MSRSAADDLGMRRALPDRLLPGLVAAMVFLAALALAGALAASGLAARWRSGPAAMITVTVPLPAPAQIGLQAGTPTGVQGGSAADAAAAVLAVSPAVAGFRRLPDTEISQLLKPWLGEDPGQLSLRLPAMFEVRLKPTASGLPAADEASLNAKLVAAAPGAVVEHNGEWLGRLSALTRSLRACAGLAVLVVTGLAAAVVVLAARAGLAACRESIDIMHGLGAADGLIAAQFAHRIMVLVLAGALPGVLAALPVVLGLARLAAPFRGVPAADTLASLPPLLWEMLAALPLAAAAIGWVTAHLTVRVWLRRLP